MDGTRRTLSVERRRSASDAVLVSRAADGDVDAFAELVRRHQRVVFSVARSAGLGRDDAADVAQLAFVALADSIASVTDGARVRSWLCTVARRQSWRLLAKRDREVLVDPPDRPADHDSVGRVDAVVDLVDALDRLRPRCRELLTALYFREPPLDYVEVADELGMPIGSIGPTRSRCLDQLRSIVDQA